ncbi:MAG: TIGR03564 family F420-dependent LLM class oxidoreductase [Acidimicrobiales bacterium]
MRIGFFGGSDVPTLDAVVVSARRAHERGFDTFWLPQVTGLDALVALAVVAREVPVIELATAVVPIQGRHPLPLALAALTVADAAGPGRFTLGLGVTHPSVSEGWFGVPYRGIVDACGEVLAALQGLFSESRRADVDGEHLRVHASTTIRAAAPGIVLAAMGPRMIRLAGTHADGTLTWMSGPEAVRLVATRMCVAASAAGRPAPHVAVGIPVCVTDDAPSTRAKMARYMDMAARMPAYRRQLDIEGVPQPVDLAVVGTEAEVDEHLDRFVAAGMTELCANIVGSPEDVERTMAHLGSRRSAS